MLPSFIGIGVPRGGTTWLHELLDSHPDVVVPQRRKEVHFFDQHYDRGLSWYEAFFPADDKVAKEVIAAEVTPHYLYDDACPQRMASMPSVKGLILLLRNPVTRAFSHYQLRMRVDGYRGTFEDYLQIDATVIERGFYTQKIRNYLQYFPREKILILIHEHAFQDPLATRRQIANFLGIDEAKFPAQAGTGQVNAIVLPRLRTTYHLLHKLSKKFRDHDLDWIPNLGKRLGIRRAFDKRATTRPVLMDPTRQRLQALFAEDIHHLEALLHMDLSIWKR